MDERSDRFPAPALLRAFLVVFVLLWILGPYSIRSAIPIWLPFLVALGLEVQFLVAALRSSPGRLPDRRPQTVDRERFGYAEETDELLLVDVDGEEVWIPYAGETEEELDDLIADALEREEEAAVAGPHEPAARPLLPQLRSFLTGLVVIAALGAVVWFFESRTGWSALDGDTRSAAVARFSEEASVIAGKEVRIRCDESRDYVGAVQHADGVAIVGGDRAYLTPERCHDLYRLAFEGEVRSSRTGRAVAVLAHEAWHLRGVSDEATTECYALQSGVDLGRRLGLSEETARRLMRQQLTENALRGAATAEYVLTPECRDGGALDLDPADDRFP